MSFNHSTFPPTVLDNNNNLYFILITITYITTAIHAISINTQDTSKRKTGNWKIDCERRREEHKTLLNFPSPKSLNYYWLLLFYFNIVHSLWTNNIKSILVWHVHIIHLLVF